jgi:hypothetical protein
MPNSQVTLLKNQLDSGVRGTGQMNEWFATHRPEDVMDDIQSGRVMFLETELVGSILCEDPRFSNINLLHFSAYCLDMHGLTLRLFCVAQGQSCYEACEGIGQVVAVLSFRTFRF